MLTDMWVFPQSKLCSGYCHGSIIEEQIYLRFLKGSFFIPAMAYPGKAPALGVRSNNAWLTKIRV
jgi:hypothetical protein